MITKRAWEAYPSTYRAREMKILGNWIQAGESGTIIGLAGAGKSNLLGFLSHRPEVIVQHMKNSKNSAFQLALIQVDLNNLPDNTLATFYRVILRSLYEARTQWADLGFNPNPNPNLNQTLTTGEISLVAAVEGLYRKVEAETDPFLAQSALREALILFREYQARLVFVLDPFDQFCRTATTQVLDNLRGLRDSFKTTISYIVGLRQELAYIRDPLQLGELYEILDTHLCWLGPMVADDARWVIHQVEETTDQPFTETQIEYLIALTGGHPALLKAASLWLAGVSPIPELTTWAEMLLAEPSLQNRLQDLRRGLTGEEEAALCAWQATLTLKSNTEQTTNLKQIEAKYQSVLSRLKAKHLCLQTHDGWRIFSPLFAKFIVGLEGVSAGKIWQDKKTDRFFQGEVELSSLSEKNRRLLRYFLAHPLAIHTIDDLIETAWVEDDTRGVSNAAVQQAIRHLRKQIELNPAKPCYLMNEHGVGYRFFPEGAPRGP